MSFLGLEKLSEIGIFLKLTTFQSRKNLKNGNKCNVLGKGGGWGVIERSLG